MNREILMGKWNEIKGQVQSKWGMLTNDDLVAVGGKFDALAAALQKRYGLAKDRAEQELDAFITSVGGKSDSNVSQARSKEVEPKSDKPQPHAR